MPSPIFVMIIKHKNNIFTLNVKKIQTGVMNSASISQMIGLYLKLIFENSNDILRKETFNLTMYSAHFVFGYIASDVVWEILYYIQTCVIPMIFANHT